ncbi:MAG: hypothetical protein ACP5MU_06660 [Thermoplasmata archaeon]
MNMGIFKKEKEKNYYNDIKDFKEISELLGEFNAHEIELFVIMSRAAERSPEGPYKNAMSIYLDKTRTKLNEIEDYILNEGHKLITRHLLDDVDEDEYIEGMEEMKMKLKILRDVQEYTEFMAKKQISGQKNDNIVTISTNSGSQ